VDSCGISGLTHEVDANCALLGYYGANSGNFLQTVWNNLSALNSGAIMSPIGCPETSVRNYHYSLRNDPEERSPDVL